MLTSECTTELMRRRDTFLQTVVLYIQCTMKDALQCLKSLHHTEEKNTPEKYRFPSKKWTGTVSEVSFFKKKKKYKAQNGEVALSNVARMLRPASRRLASAGSVCSALRIETEMFPSSCSRRD